MAYVGILSPRVPVPVGTLSHVHLLRRVAAPPSALALSLKVLPERVVVKRFNVRRPPIAAFLDGARAGGDVLQDAGATALVIAGAYGLVSTFDNLTRRNIIEQNLSRKLVHILSGLLFLASWPIFSMLYYFSALGYIELEGVWTLERVALVSLVATVVESLPIMETVDDDISVPLASMMAAFLVFSY